jgi:hypothetical protein
LQRMKFVLAMAPDDFQKPGSFVWKLKALKRKAPKSKLTWSVFLVQHSLQFSKLALEDQSLRRCEIAARLGAEGEPVWDTQFIWSNVAEGEGRLVEYTSVDSSLQGRSKAEIQKSMQGIIGCGPFFTQHAMLLLTGGGRADTASKIGIKALQDSCILGGGSHRLLKIVLEEYLGFSLHQHAKLCDTDWDSLAIVERAKWREATMKSGCNESDLPLCLQKCGPRLDKWVVISAPKVQRFELEPRTCISGSIRFYPVLYGSIRPHAVFM